MELAITDLSQNRRNLFFSTSHKELNIQPLSARIPIKYLNRTQWTNYVFDLAVLVNELWKNQTLKSIDSLTISANCKLRKIFTLKNVPNTELDELCTEDALQNVNFPEETNSQIQIFSLSAKKENVTHMNLSSINNNGPEASSLASSRSRSQNVFKIAFGSKVPKSGSPLNGQPMKSAKSQSQIEQVDKSNSIYFIKRICL